LAVGLATFLLIWFYEEVIGPQFAEDVVADNEDPDADAEDASLDAEEGASQWKRKVQPWIFGGRAKRTYRACARRYSLRW
jgi:hypothetical protein